jgi:hypothetical protein
VGFSINVEVREIKNLNRGGRGANAAVFAEGSFDCASPSLREADPSLRMAKEKNGEPKLPK